MENGKSFKVSIIVIASPLPECDQLELQPLVPKLMLVFKAKFIHKISNIVDIFYQYSLSVVKTVCKTMEASGTALCCAFNPAIGCAIHVVGEGLGVLNEAVERNVQDHAEEVKVKKQKIMEVLHRIEMKMDDLKASMTNLLDKVGDQEERLTCLEGRLENLGLEQEPKRKKKLLDPNRKIECFMCGGEFSASNMSKHQDEQ